MTWSCWLHVLKVVDVILPSGPTVSLAVSLGIDGWCVLSQREKFHKSERRAGRGGLGVALEVCYLPGRLSSDASFLMVWTDTDLFRCWSAKSLGVLTKVWHPVSIRFMTRGWVADPHFTGRRHLAVERFGALGVPSASKVSTLNSY